MPRAIGIGIGTAFGGSVLTEAPFSPLDLSPALWLDASDLSTITESSGAVSQWNDKSGNGRHFAQATAASQPTTAANTLNGLNVLDFASDFLTSSDSASTWNFLHNGTDYMVAIVVKPGTTADPNNVYGLLGTDAGAASANIGADLFWDDRASITRNDRIVHTVVRGVGGTSASSNVSGDNAMAANSWHVATLLADPDNATAATRSRLFVGSGSAIANNVSTNAPSVSNASFTLQIGAAGNNAVPLTGAIAEVVIVSGANAIEDNRVELRDYLNDKWGL